MKFSGSGCLAAALAMAAAILVGCGTDDVKPAEGDGSVATVDNGPSPTASGEAEGGTDLPSDEEVEAYFDAVSTYDIDDLELAMELSEPGSIAEAYAGYILASANSAIDGGVPLEGEEPRKVTGGYESCPPEDPESCATWTDIEGRDGRIVKFRVNGEDIGDRLAAGNGQSVQAGSLARAELLYAYRSVQSDALFVLVRIESGEAPITVATYEGTYRAPEGRQSQSSQNSGPTELMGDSSATVALVFPGAEVGGTTAFPIYSDDFMTERVVELKTR